ncbi:leucine-rich repeat-containing protein 74A [Ammospiza maritima maritima]
MSEPQESVLLAGASAEKAMQAPDTDLGVENPEKAFADIIGTKPIYLEAHRLMEVVPASHLIQNLAKPYINLNHHVLGPKGVKDIVNAMVNISNKHLDTSGPKAIATLLLVNLSYLNVFQLLGVVCTPTLMAGTSYNSENFFGNIDKDGNIKIPVAAFWKAMMQVCL